jgi:hypothetical protein
MKVTYIKIKHNDCYKIFSGDQPRQVESEEQRFGAILCFHQQGMNREGEINQNLPAGNRIKFLSAPGASCLLAEATNGTTLPDDGGRERLRIVGLYSELTRLSLVCSSLKYIWRSKV